MRFRNKKVLILGASIVQKDLIEYCKMLGMQTHLCSNSIKKRSKEMADFSALVDIGDMDKIMNYVDKNSIDIVYSIGSDIAMLTSSYISEIRSLPYFVSSRTVHKCNNKYRMRSIFSGIKELEVKFQKIDSMKGEIVMDFPFIMKPADSWGQRGVFLINNISQYNEKFYESIKFSRANNLILEEYIEGPEVSVNVYVIDGEIAFSVIMDRIPVLHNHEGIVLKHRIPSDLPSRVQYRINKLISTALKKLNIFNGPVYFQIKIKKKTPRIIEIAPRLDGCHLWRLIKYHSSIDLVDVTFKHLLGEKPNFSPRENTVNNNLKLEFLYDYPGAFVDRNKYSFLKNYRYLEWYYEQGERVLPLNEVYEKVGYYISGETES